MANNRSDWYRRRRIQDWEDRFNRGYDIDYSSARPKRMNSMDWERRQRLEDDFDDDSVIHYSDYYAGQDFRSGPGIGRWEQKEGFDRPGGWFGRRGAHQADENRDWQEGRYWRNQRPGWEQDYPGYDAGSRMPYRDRRYTEHFGDPNFNYEYDEDYGDREWFPEERSSGDRTAAQRRWESYRGGRRPDFERDRSSGRPDSRQRQYRRQNSLLGGREGQTGYEDLTRPDVGAGMRGFEYDWEGEPYDMDFEYVEFWNTPGPYTGMGPEGYRRSDDRIKEDIHDQLTRHPHLDARNIEIQVNNGEVTLNGTVENRNARRLAERIAEDTRGVTGVNNRLKTSETQREGYTPGYWGETRDVRRNMRQGMDVVGRQGRFIGQVKSMREDDFLIDRPLARDVFVPFEAVQRIDGQVMLNIPADQIGDQGWEKPPLF